MKKILDFIKETVSQWLDHNAFQMSAALAYYTIFSLGPLVLIAVSVAGFFFGHAAALGELEGQLRAVLGEAGASAVQALMAGMDRPRNNLIATVIGLSILIFGAAGVFTELKSALNRIWKVAPDKSSGLAAFIRTRLLSFVMVLAIGFLLLASLILSAVLAAVDASITQVIPIPPFFFHAGSFLANFLVITVLFALIFKILPEAPIHLKDVWVGAVVTSLLFTVGKNLIGLYLGRSTIASIYGASGSIIILLLWAYYSSLIFFLGAEFTEVYARRYGSQRSQAKRTQ